MGGEEEEESDYFLPGPSSHSILLPPTERRRRAAGSPLLISERCLYTYAYRYVRGSKKRLFTVVSLGRGLTFWAEEYRQLYVATIMMESGKKYWKKKDKLFSENTWLMIVIQNTFNMVGHDRRIGEFWSKTTCFPSEKTPGQTLTDWYLIHWATPPPLKRPPT